MPFKIPSRSRTLSHLDPEVCGNSMLRGEGAIKGVGFGEGLFPTNPSPAQYGGLEAAPRKNFKFSNKY